MFGIACTRVVLLWLGFGMLVGFVLLYGLVFDWLVLTLLVDCSKVAFA